MAQSNHLDLRHHRFVCNIKVQCKEVNNKSSLLSVIMILIARHFSAYSKASSGSTSVSYRRLICSTEFRGIYWSPIAVTPSILKDWRIVCVASEKLGVGMGE